MIRYVVSFEDEDGDRATLYAETLESALFKACNGAPTGLGEIIYTPPVREAGPWLHFRVEGRPVTIQPVGPE